MLARRALGHHGTIIYGKLGRLEKNEVDFDMLMEKKFKIS